MLMTFISPEPVVDGLHFLSHTVYAYHHCAHRTGLPNLTEVAKNAEKDEFRGFKVIRGYLVCHQSKGRMRLPISS